MTTILPYLKSLLLQFTDLAAPFCPVLARPHPRIFLKYFAEIDRVRVTGHLPDHCHVKIRLAYQQLFRIIVAKGSQIPDGRLIVVLLKQMA